MTVAELSRFLEQEGLLSPAAEGTDNIVNLAGSVSAWLGDGAPAQEGGRDEIAGTASGIDWLDEKLAGSRGLVFIIADGLGIDLTARHAPGGTVEQTMASELRSVYPSTTATALTSLASATWAGRHGVTGWWTHIPHLSRTLCALTYRERGTGATVDSLGLSMEDIVSARSMYRTNETDITSILPAQIASSPYARWTRNETRILGYRTLGHAFRRAGRRARKADGRFLISVYLPQVDSTVHKWGTDHAETHAVIGELDRNLGRFLERLPPDVAVVLTADHGLIDLDRSLHEVVEDGDPILEHLVVPPTGEGTNPVFHVPDGGEEALREALDHSEAGSSFRLVPTDTLSDAGFFGPDGIDPRVRARFGSHLGIATRPALLEHVPAGFRSKRHRGIHGGLRPGEMRVPLCLATR
jgi:hypothetical protein